MKAEECILFSGAANGAEAAFGAAAQRHGVAEVNFTFEGHNDARTRGIRVLTEPELKQGDVNLHYVSRFDAPRISRHAAVSARAPEHLAPGEQRPRGVRGRAYSRRRPPATRPRKVPLLVPSLDEALFPRTGFKSSRGSWQPNAARTPLVARGYQRTGEEPIDNRSGALRMKSRTWTADRSRHRGFPAGNRPAARWDESAPAGTRQDRTGGAISTGPSLWHPSDSCWTPRATGRSPRRSATTTRAARAARGSRRPRRRAPDTGSPSCSCPAHRARSAGCRR